MYQRQITHQHRAAFVLLLDCSASMSSMTKLNNLVMSKADAVALLSSLIIDELIERAMRYHKVRDYYDIAVIGYQESSVRSLLPEPLGDGFVSVDYLAKFAPAHRIVYFDQRLENGGVISAPFSYRPWIMPSSSGRTPMYEALLTVRDMLKAWCNDADNREHFPPVVINITDGECNDAGCEDLIAMAQSIRECSTSDGSTLFINVHLSTLDEFTTSELFPSEKSFATDSRYCQMLYDMSSTIPASLEQLIYDTLKTSGVGPFRAMAFNASPIELFSILNIGSESARTLR